MRLNPIHLLYALLAAAVIWWAVGFFSGEERRIRKELSRLETLLTKGEGEGNVAAANRARQLGDLFAESFEIELGSRGGTLTERGALARVALRYRREYETIEANLRPEDLEIGPTGRLAEMEVTAHLFGRRRASPSRESYRLALRYVLEDGDWRISRAQLLEILEGPGWL